MMMLGLKGLKCQLFKGKYEPELEFPEGRGGGVQTKKPSVGGVWIFSGTTRLINNIITKVRAED